MPLNEGAYAALSDGTECHLAAANSALFLVVYTLVRLGYFLNLSKSVLIPRVVVPYLGFLINAADEVFEMIPHKKTKFLSLLDDILKERTITIKTLQKLVGKCVSFSLAGPAAILCTREMNLAISAAQRTGRLIYLRGPLREEISHWSFVRTWSQPLPWREEKHIRVSIASDASSSGWGGHITAPIQASVSDYWSPDELHQDTASGLSGHRNNASFRENGGASAILFPNDLSAYFSHITRGNAPSCTLIFPWCSVGLLHKRNQGSLIPSQFLG